MSAPPQSRSGSFSGGGMPPQQTPVSAGAGGPHAPPPRPQENQQNLNQIVLEYLNKKGFSRSEATLRQESARVDQDGRPIIDRMDDLGGVKYAQSFALLRNWIENSLDIYRPELRRLLWPIFVHCFLRCMEEYYEKEAERFFDQHKGIFEAEHSDKIRQLATIKSALHVDQSETAQHFIKNNYRLTLTEVAFQNLIQFLESKESQGGSIILGILNARCHIVHVDRANLAERSLASLMNKSALIEDFPAEDEGIPGHGPGSAAIDPKAPATLARLNLGHPPADPDFLDDVRAQLQEEDAKNPVGPGQQTYLEEFEQRVKREQTEDAPSRDLMPIPPLLSRNVAMEVQRVKENRDRFKLEGRTGGIGPGVSVAMYTFMNSCDSINCLDFSGDYTMVAAGTSQSFIRVWSTDGEPLRQDTQQDWGMPSNSKHLIGHAGPVYSVAFSPSTMHPDSSNVHDRVADDKPKTTPLYLLSGSGDGTIRLWSLDVWTQLVVYRGHAGPVWDVSWDSFGYYFVSAGYDRSARVWTTDSITPHRLLVGHDNCVSVVTLHPNGTYVFTGSDDKTIRMWDGRGNPVRMFTGHTGNPTAIACSPDGFLLATADDAGTIIVWNLVQGRLSHRLRGHGRGGIWSLTWSVESSVLVSCGADGTVRAWDMTLDKDRDASKGLTDVGASLKVDGVSDPKSLTGASATTASGGAAGSGSAVGASAAGSNNANAGGATGGTNAATGRKGKQRDNIVSPEQISAFPTKKSAVYKVLFTQSNLVIAGGAYLPETM